MKNKIAIVTGASRLKGIGASICNMLADNKIDVFFTYWTPYDKKMPWGVEEDEPLRLQHQLQNKGVRCECAEIDLTDTSSINHLLDIVHSQLGEPSVLINNATYSTTTDYKTLNAKELDEHYAVNLRATALLSVDFIRRFKQGTGGRIINLTSGQSLGPMPDELAYAATKGAIDALTLSLSPEAGKKGITVNAVDPGPTDTGWMTGELKDYLSSRFPSGRVGVPKDVTYLIKFLVSEEGEWVNGQIIHSNGGFR